MNQQPQAETQSKQWTSGRATGLSWVGLVLSVPLLLFAYSLLGRFFFSAELINNFRLQLLIAMLPGAWYGLRRQHLPSMVAFGVAIAWAMMGTVWIQVSMRQPATETERIRIMSFNVLVASDDHLEVVQRITQLDPDIVTLVEYDHTWHDELPGLSEVYPHSLTAARWHGFGLAVFSKHPLLESETFQLIGEYTDTPMLVTAIQVGDRRLRLAATHALSPTTPFRMQLRNQQFREAAEILSRERQPTIVMGDFNCVPWSPFLTDFCVATGYRDSRQGFGYQATWHRAFWPLRIPIDHAFVSSEVVVRNRFVGPGTTSDHFPIVVDISLVR